MKRNLCLKTILMLLISIVTVGQSSKEIPKGSTKYSFFTLNTLKNTCFDNVPKKQISAYIREIYEDKAGVLWFGTNGDGVCRYDGMQMKFLSKKDGLVGNQINGITEDKNGNIWLATDEGLSKYDGKRFTNYTTKNGLANNQLWSILLDRKGNIWVGTLAGVNTFDGKKFHKIDLPKLEKPGVPRFNQTVVWSMIEDRMGNIWFGTDGGGLKKFDGKTVYTYSQKSGMSSNNISSVFEDHEGTVWLGTLGGGISRFDGKKFTNYGEKEGLSSVNVWTIYEDKKHQLWFGTLGGGASRFDGKTFKTFKETKGVTKNHVQSIWQDKRGNLWLGFSGGLYRVQGDLVENIPAERLVGC
jgi:ligand-binding sensor domain-containing protein